MTADSLQRLRAELVRDEGDRLDVYDDGRGNLTGGIGHNFSAHGISPAVRDLMYEEDSGRAVSGAEGLTWFGDLNEPRQRVILNMVFNLGIGGVRGFPKMIAAIRAGDFDLAAHEILDSEIPAQRKARLARVMASGCEPAPTVIRSREVA